jgi:PAS domain S-box-containing protein
MKNLFTRIPLPAKLLLIGLIPLVVVGFLFIQLYTEKTNKLRLLSNYIDHIHQSADLTHLIDHLQTERNFSYELALKKESQPSLARHRSSTDSIIKRLSTNPLLADFGSYTFLNELADNRTKIDSGRLPANQVVHYYTTVIFRLNTLNPAPPGARIYLPELNDDIVSQKLLSEIITYLGIASTNVYNALYTKAYMTETLIGTLGTYQVYNTYEKEFLLKGSSTAIPSYQKIRNDSTMKAMVNYLDRLFKTFSFDSTYNAQQWEAVSDRGIDQLRNLQQNLLQKINTDVVGFYERENAAKNRAFLWLVLLVALVILVVIYTINSINKTLANLRKDAELIALGINASHLNGAVSNDVIGRLTRSIHKIDENNRMLANAAEAIGKGDFEIPFQTRGKDDVLGNAIIKMKKGLLQLTTVEKDIANFAAIVQYSQDAIISKTLEGVVISWNPGAERLFGYTADEMIGEMITRLMPADRIIEEQQILSLIRRGEHVEHFTTIRRHKSGKLLDISLTISPVKDSTGQIIAVSKIARDITEMVKARKQIEESEDRLRLAIEATRMGTFDWDLVTNEFSSSQRLNHIFGFDERYEITHLDLQGAIHPDDKAIRDKAVEESAAKGSLRYETRVCWPDGSVHWVKVYGKIMYDVQGKPLRMYGTAMDVTEERTILHALGESEQRLQIAIQAAEMGTWEVDLKKGIPIYSTRYLEILGYQENEKPSHEELVTRIHPDDRQLRDNGIAKAIETGVLDIEVRIISKNNKLRWIRSRGRVFYNDDGSPYKMLGTIMDITEQKETEQTLQYRKALLEAHNEATGDGILLVDRKGKILSFNHRFLEIWNMPAHFIETRDEGEALKFAITRLVYPQQFIDKIRYIYENSSEASFDELEFLDGKIIERRGYPVTGQGGNYYAWSWVFRDITAQKQIDLALKESEERFKTIANTAPVMIWMSGSDKFSDFFNISWLNFTGRTIAQESGDGWLKGVHPDDAQNCINTYNEAYSKQQAFGIEYRLRRHDGKYRWISDNAVPRVTPEGKFIGFISACHDIDDEKRFNEKLKESELLFKTITNVSPAGLWMTDDKGDNNFVNDTWIEWTGINQESQHAEGWFNAVIPEDKEEIGLKFQQSFQTRQNFSAEFRILRKGGEVRWVLSEGSPYYDIEGNFAGYAGSVTDITERKQDEIRKNDFLAVASHELKTPLTSVKAYAQLLASTYDKTNDSFLKNALGKIDNQVNKMTKLVGDFLNLSKIESDKFQLNNEKFDMYELVKEIAADMQIISVNHSIVIEKRSRVTVNADREKISQVITNFLNNAVKYSPVDKNITISVGIEEGNAKVSVSDKGIGIKAEEQEKIFERFYRSKFNNNISFSGFGIGLYISAEIIRRHKGEIGVVSDSGKGALFYFTLPVVN